MKVVSSLIALLFAGAEFAGTQIQTDSDLGATTIVAAPDAGSSTVSTQGRTATIGEVQVGERQTRTRAVHGSRPLDRVQNRIVTRIDNRLRTRIDRNYDPNANTQPLLGITTATDASRESRSK